MEKKVAGLKSLSMNVESGTHFFCTCGHSEKQPFCDGKHSPEFKPKRYTFQEAGNHSFCLCKASYNMPFCDGRHRCLKN